MTSPRLTICLSLAAAGLLIWGVSHRLAARGSAAAELVALRGMGHPISLAELAARFPPVPPAENAGSALEAVLAQVTDNSSDSTAAALLDPDRGPTKPSSSERTPSSQSSRKSSGACESRPGAAAEAASSTSPR